MTDQKLSSAELVTALSHYYRAEVQRSLAWRDRLDRTTNWAVAGTAEPFGKLILSGGLSPDNVEDALRTARPYAVDASSGVDSKPGKKDHAKVKAFVATAKAFNR